MNKENEYTVTIHLIHGDPVKFRAELTDAEMLSKADDIEYMLNRYALGLELDGKLVVIPYNNIKYLEAYPAPPNLPIFMVRRAVSIP